MKILQRGTFLAFSVPS